MRFIDFNPTLLNEAALSATGLHANYITNLVDMVVAGLPIPVSPKYSDKYGETVILAPATAEILTAALQSTIPEGPGKKYLGNWSVKKIETADGEMIPFGAIEKSPGIIKGLKFAGANLKANLGYVGEISLGLAAGLKFLNAGAPVDPIQFVNLANKLSVAHVRNSKGQKGDSMELSFAGTITHLTGKEDDLKILIRAPGNDVKAFMELMKNPGDASQEERGAILSALKYAEESKKIRAGLDKTASDENSNTIEVISDGISGNKGTKADLVMEIDKSRINLLSVKTGKGQLGQASGHEWEKQAEFFQTVFGVDVSPYKELWGTTSNADHLVALQKIWSTLVIPKVLKLTGGNITAKEKALVKSIATGLIRYSNNINAETGEIETVDIVKLLTNPGSPGYKMMQIDSKLTDAMDKTDLIGSYPSGGMGINIHGIITTTNSKGLTVKKQVALCRMWSSESGKTIRTAVAGGPLLEVLAEMAIEEPTTPAVRSTANAVQSPAPAVSAPTPTTPAVVPATPPVAPQQAQPVNGEEEVAEEQGSWKPYTDKHVSELEHMLRLAKYNR